MAQGVCPHWVGWFLLNPLRRLIHNPDQILASYVSGGMTVLDIGPGMGFFTLPLAGMVGPGGQVIAVDIQADMLSALQRRAQAVHLAERIVTAPLPADLSGAGRLRRPDRLWAGLRRGARGSGSSRFLRRRLQGVETGGLFSGGRTEVARLGPELRGNSGRSRAKGPEPRRPTQDHLVPHGSLEESLGINP